MKRLIAFISLAFIIASCAPADPTVEYDWCYTHNFVDEEFNITTGYLGIDNNLYSNTDGLLSATYTHNTAVDAARVLISFSRVFGSTGDVTVTTNSLVYNIPVAVSGTLPDGQSNAVLEFVPSGDVLLNRDTIAINADATQQFTIDYVTIKGYGSNPYPLNECNPLGPTSTNTPIYTNTPTATRTLAPSPTGTLAGVATTTATPSASPTASTTPIPQFTCTWDVTDLSAWSAYDSSPYDYAEYVSGSGWRRFSNSAVQARLVVVSPVFTANMTSISVKYSIQNHVLTSTGNTQLRYGSLSTASGTYAAIYGGSATVSDFTSTGSYNITGERLYVSMANNSATNGTSFPSNLYITEVSITGTGTMPGFSVCYNSTPTSTPTTTPTITTTPTPSPTGTITPTATTEPLFYCLYNFQESAEGWEQFSASKQAYYTLANGMGWQTVYDALNDPYSRAMYVKVPFTGLVTRIIATFDYTRGNNSSTASQYNASLGSMNDLLNGISNYLVTNINITNGQKQLIYDAEFFVDYGIGFTAKSGYDGFSPFIDPGGEVTLRNIAVWGRGTIPSSCYEVAATPTPTATPIGYTAPTSTRTPLPTPLPATSTRTPIVLATRTPIGGGIPSPTITPPTPTPGTPTAVVITSTPDGTATSIVQTATAMYGGTPSPNPSSSVTPLVGTGVWGTPYGTPETQFGWGACAPNCGPLSWTWGLGGLQDLLDMIGFIVQIVSGFINLIFQWIGQVITRLFALISTFWSTPAQPIPGLPQCVTAPLTHDLCAIYYIMDWTLFAPSTPGAYIIPIVVTLMNLYFVFYFIRFIYWLVKRNVKDVTDVT